jgi:hypothetical protein
VLVEMRRVLGQYVFEMAPIEDQYSVEQLAAQGADPSFGDGVRSGCQHWCAQDADGVAGEHGIEDVGEFAVATPDQEPELSRAVAEVHQQVAGLLGDPGSGQIRGDAQEVHAAGGMLDYEQDVEPVQQQRVDAEEVRGENAVCWARRNSRQLGPSRRGAGSMPARFRINHTVLGASR